MKRTFSTLLALAGAGLLLAACEGGATLPAPGGARTSTDPFVECWNDSCPPPPIEGNDTTPGAMYAVYKYGSSVRTWTQNSYKYASLGARSEAVAHVAHTTLNASFYLQGAYACYGGSGTWTLVDQENKSGSGSPLTLTASYLEWYNPVLIYMWKVEASHSFTPNTGYLGGGTFTSSHIGCL